MFVFRLKRTVKLGVKSLWMHRLRSTLTTLGIIFGVASVIAMLAIGEGASRDAQEQIARLGSRNVIIKTIKPPEEQDASGQSDSMLDYGLTYSDAERFRNGIPDVEVIVPIRRLTEQAWYRNRKASIEIVGTVPWHPDTSPIKLKMGRFLSSTDMHYKQSVCAVDERVVRELFAFDDPLGQDVKISSDYYRVVGIVSAQTSKSGESGLTSEASAQQGQSGANLGNIYIPLTTVKDRFGEISLQFSGTSRNIEKVELQEIIVKVGTMENVLPVRDILGTLLARFHKKPDYQVIVPLELLKQAERTKLIFSIVLGSIAAISLVVGGIGIMNIMLATVSERTREIGIRRALGAKKNDIIIQFLSETLILTLAGGVLGIILGSLIPFLVTYFGKMPTVITTSSLILSFGISAAVGITFGLYPAYRAANMDPIESLRHE
ncbi:MAG: ABC transporter permease [Planctomycetes bacterium]|nr:ABC transporter permease [Planctomycetota bacterium]MBL7144681.1 ABC transporter permease [Phycisphaerae bacterium]